MTPMSWAMQYVRLAMSKVKTHFGIEEKKYRMLLAMLSD